MNMKYIYYIQNSSKCNFATNKTYAENSAILVSYAESSDNICWDAFRFPYVFPVELATFREIYTQDIGNPII